MRENWDAVSSDEAVRRLKSNASVGLSHKEARSRYRKKRLDGESEFFYVPKKSFFSILAVALSDFSFWTVALTCVSLAFFEHTALAAVGFVLLLVQLVLTVTLAKISAYLSEGLSYAFTEQIKVIRDGKLLSSDPRCIVRGDIVLLTEGDVIPFDARILSEDRFVVSVYCGKDEDGKKRFVKASKSASYCAPGKGIPEPQKRHNMVTAGSIVLSGSARVVVTETGAYTYFGGFSGGISILKGEDPNRSLTEIRSRARAFGVRILMLSVPLMLFSFLLSGAEDPAISFYSALALSCVALSGWICTLYEFLAVYAIYRLARREKHVLLRTVTAAERLPEADVVALFGRAMITDGFPHVTSMFSEGRVYSASALKNDACRRLAESAILPVIAATRFPISGSDVNDPNDLYRASLLRFSERVGADHDGAEIRYRFLAYHAPTHAYPTELLRYADANGENEEERILMCSFDDLLFVRCTHLRTERGKEPLTFEKRASVRQAIHAHLAHGCEIRSYAEKEQSGDVTFLGFIAFSERIRTETKDSFHAFSEMGVRTLLFLDGESPEERHYAIASGACRAETEIAYASVFHRKNLPITHAYGSYTAYLGFSTSEIAALLDDLRAKSLAVCGVLMHPAHLSLMQKLSVSLVPGAFHALTSREDRVGIREISVGGVSHTASVSGRMKLSADGIVERSSKEGTGLTALLSAFRLGLSIKTVRQMLIDYLSAFFAFSLGWLIPALIGVRDLFAANGLIFTSVIANSFFALLLLGDVGHRIPLSQKRESRKRVWGRMTALALCGILLSVIPLLSSWLFDLSYEKAASLRTLILIAASAVLLLRTRMRILKRLRLDVRTVISIAAVPILMLLCAVFPGIASLIGIPSCSLLQIPLLLPVLILLLL